MFSVQRFSLLLNFSLLVLSLLWVNQADAQTIEVVSLDSDNCASTVRCASPSQGSSSLPGSLAVADNLQDLLAKAPQVHNPGSFLGIDVNGFSKADGFGARGSALSLGLSNGNRNTLDPDEQSFNSSEWISASTQGVGELAEKETIPNSALLPGGEALVSTPSPLPGEALVSTPSPLPGEASLPDSAPRSRNRVPPDFATLPGGGTVFPTPSPLPDEIVGTTLPGEDVISTPFPPPIGLASPDAETVPEPSISLLAWLGVAGIGVFSARSRSKR